MAEEAKSNVPNWVTVDLFENVFRETVPGYKKCISFDVKPGLAPGENYSTLMLRISAKLELQGDGGDTKSVSFMLKVCHDNELVKDFLKHYNSFEVEKTVFDVIKPELEQLYADAGMEVKFGAKSYNLPTKEWYLLLEDLGQKGFKNASRIDGLDMEHSLCVLKKMAQMHAASAVRVAQKGPYEKKYEQGHLVDGSKPLTENLFSSMRPLFISSAKEYTNSEEYIEDFVSVLFELLSG